MKCPKCHGKMHKKQIQDVEVDECQDCEGIWCDEIELQQIKDKSDSDLHWLDFDFWKHPDKFEAKAGLVACPSCQKTMDVIQYSDNAVEIDFCADCKSIWLDKNELEKIIEVLETEVLNKPVSEYVVSTLEEAKDLLTKPDAFLSEWKDFSTILRFLQYRILSLKPVIHDTLVSFQNNSLNR